MINIFIYIGLVFFLHKFTESNLSNHLNIEFQKDTLFELTCGINKYYRNNPFIFRIISTIYYLCYDLIMLFNMILNNHLISLFCIIYIIRFICLYLVILPVDKNIQLLNSYLPTLGNFYINDFFFSGHTAILILATLLNWNEDYIKYINLILLNLTIFIMITTRMHYTQDIITGLSVGINIYYLFY